MTNGEYILPYALESFEINNVRGIKHTYVNELPKSAQWIFLTGENGYGKTSILQVIASGLFETHELERRFRWGRELNYKNISDEELIDLANSENYNVAKKALLEAARRYPSPQKPVVLFKKNEENNSYRGKTYRGNILKEMQTYRGMIDILRDRDRKFFVVDWVWRPNKPRIKKTNIAEIKLNTKITTNFEKICCYGSSRLNIAPENSTQKENPIEGLFDTQVSLKNIEYQLSRWYHKKNNDRDAEKREFATKYETVTKLFVKLLDLDKIEVDFNNDSIFYYEKDELGKGYNKVTLKELAAGYRSIISMVGDMILRLFDTQPDVYDPAELSGIVIIDELDLHLHPKWQKRLPGLLSKIFPRVQFIASTHSPIPLLGAPEHSVFLKVNRDAENGITVERLEDMEKQISNLLPNTILTSPIFGMRDIFPVTHDPENGIRTEDTYAEIEFNEQVKQELKSYLGTERTKELEQLFKSE